MHPAESFGCLCRGSSEPVTTASAMAVLSRALLTFLLVSDESGVTKFYLSSQRAIFYSTGFLYYFLFYFLDLSFTFIPTVALTLSFFF